MTNSTKVVIVGLATAVAEVGAFYVAARLRSETDTRVAFAFFFPISTVLSLPFLHAIALSIVTMLAQFPIYGYLIGQAWIRGHLRRTALRIAVVHAISAVAGVCSLMIIRV
jgi:hypothetical protein